MNEQERNEVTADHICRHLQWDGQRFQFGQCVALLDGSVIAIAKDLQGALTALRSLDSNPHRGMVVEVAPPTLDVIRQQW